MNDIWAQTHEERQLLIDGLKKLPEEDWSKPSLSAGWTVTDVVGHIIATNRMTTKIFLRELWHARFSFKKMSNQNIRDATRGANPAQLIRVLENHRLDQHKPPGPVLTVLCEAVVHSEDIFRALGPYGEHPEAHLVAVADFLKKNSLLIPGKKRIAGLTFTATDAGWKAGSGPEVRGPLVALVMALAGRGVALDDLEGEGLEQLRGRMG